MYSGIKYRHQSIFDDTCRKSARQRRPASSFRQSLGFQSISSFEKKYSNKICVEVSSCWNSSAEFAVEIGGSGGEKFDAIIARRLLLADLLASIPLNSAQFRSIRRLIQPGEEVGFCFPRHSYTCHAGIQNTT